MGGISRIAQMRDGTRSAQSSAPSGRELWFKDGDQAFLTSAATGEDGDDMFDEIYLYTFKDGNRWTNLLADKDVDTSHVPENYRPSHKFAFWAYVYEVIHTTRRSDDWIEVQAGNRKAFKEEVNDFRMISLSFGRSDYIWNQLIDVFNDWNQNLQGGVMRVKRTGTGMYDTSYTITSTVRNIDVPEEKKNEITELPNVKGYFKSRYGGSSNSSDAISVNGTNDKELF